jgi:AcrR family transcriptional regulator
MWSRMGAQCDATIGIDSCLAAMGQNPGNGWRNFVVCGRDIIHAGEPGEPVSLVASGYAGLLASAQDSATVTPPDSGGSAVGLRETKKGQTRVDFVSAAVQLFSQRGFEATTIDDICARAGFSERTFFRYFRSKEDLVFGDLPERVEKLRSALKADVQHANPLSVVREALIEATLAYTGMSDEGLVAVDLWYGEPALYRRYTELVTKWELAIAEYLAAAEDCNLGEVEAHVAATALCGVVRAVLRLHVAKPGGARVALEDGFAFLDDGLASRRS